MADTTPHAALILGSAGPRLTPDERRFFRDADPLGFILFARNVEAPGQVRALIAEMRDTVGRADAPVLIDQEGGRVQRLKPPHWRAAPAGAAFARLFDKNPDAAREAAYLNALLIGRELAALGITVDCAPVLDVPQPDAHDIIGDRALGVDPASVADLGRCVCRGLLAAGVAPVIKHLPGHGRARADSHEELPAVEAPLDTLEVVDFPPFRELADAPWAMTAHVVYTAIDGTEPASTSAKVIDRVIRGSFGFDGVLVSDDLGMKALSGGFETRARRVLAAGCDIALHCSGDLAEMIAVVSGSRPMSAKTCERFVAAEVLRLGAAADHISDEAALARLEEHLA
jgi:beta-N-acetylhexosaminidase